MIEPKEDLAHAYKHKFVETVEEAENEADDIREVEVITEDTPWIAHIPPGQRMLRKSINEMLTYNSVQRDEELDRKNKKL